MLEQVTLEGVVENIVFQNNLNGFSVFSISTSLNDNSKNTKDVLCVGNVPTVSVGENIKVMGTYVVHSVYGRQLSVKHYEKTLPKTTVGIEKYLGSGVIKGVRERLAKKIVEHFGEDTLIIIENCPEKLTEIKGVSLAKAITISAIFHEQAHMRSVIMFLQEYGISPIVARKIYKKYKENTIDVVKSNPYKLADEVFGIGFKTADTIAFKAGIEKDSEYRVKAGIKYTLNMASSNGHVYLPIEILLEQTYRILDVPEEVISKYMSQMQIERIIWQEKVKDVTAVYLNSFYYAENFVAKKLLELSANPIKKTVGIENKVRQIQEETGIILAKEQCSAIQEAINNGVLIVTGGPGTGKTTTINAIINILEQQDLSIELAAPTGRAAKRMSEATGMEAKTIHRLLEIIYTGGEGRLQSFGKNRDNPIETDVVIIDESSMVDILLMNSLLSAITMGTRLILVGDADQLPSVGPGNVLKDIINSGCIKVVRLTEIFRQAQESAIIMNAHRINSGQYPILNEKDKDFFFIKKTSQEDVAKTILELIDQRLPAFTGKDKISDIQVLTPMRKSYLGVLELNKLIQERLNPPAQFKKESIFGSYIYRVGDKVMQIKNNYNMQWKIVDKQGIVKEEGLGVFNGDLGVIFNIDDFEEKVTVVYDENKYVDYDFSLMDELDLSYAITIHKSQGSEYPIVIIPVFSGAPILMSRNLIYTGVTRAKEVVVIVGSPEMLNKMVDNNKELDRYTSLDKRIIKMSEVFG